MIPVIEKDLSTVFDQIILGEVKRHTHELSYNGTSWDNLFVRRLRFLGYLKTHVQDVDISPDERVPGFYLTDNMAFFGWVRWEKFQKAILRKFWGSLAVDRKGDWKYQVPAGSKRMIYCNATQKFSNDINLPLGV